VQLLVPTELLVERIAGRALAEGRPDDTPEAVRTRLKVYDELTAPVIEYYRQHGRLTVVDGGRRRARIRRPRRARCRPRRRDARGPHPGPLPQAGEVLWRRSHRRQRPRLRGSRSPR
ncbi:nucleoside monophosphate kinase, partial [Streptomyces sp. S12]|nr:nucleoside monophosphate kinase [Streptomyces sp. S12]